MHLRPSPSVSAFCLFDPKRRKPAPRKKYLDICTNIMLSSPRVRSGSSPRRPNPIPRSPPGSGIHPRPPSARRRPGPHRLRQASSPPPCKANPQTTPSMQSPSASAPANSPSSSPASSTPSASPRRSNRNSPVVPTVRKRRVHRARHAPPPARKPRDPRNAAPQPADAESILAGLPTAEHIAEQLRTRPTSCRPARNLQQSRHPAVRPGCGGTSWAASTKAAAASSRFGTTSRSGEITNFIRPAPR